MHYEIKFLCNGNIHTVTLEIPRDSFIKMDTEEKDEMITRVILCEKKFNDMYEYPHTITSMRKSENNIDWIEMI